MDINTNWGWGKRLKLNTKKSTRFRSFIWSYSNPRPQPPPTPIYFVFIFWIGIHPFCTRRGCASVWTTKHLFVMLFRFSGGCTLPPPPASEWKLELSEVKWQKVKNKKNVYNKRLRRRKVCGLKNINHKINTKYTFSFEIQHIRHIPIRTYEKTRHIIYQNNTHLTVWMCGCLSLSLDLLN